MNYVTEYSITNLAAWVISIEWRKTYYICYGSAKQKNHHFAFVHLIQMFNHVLLCHNHASFYGGKVQKFFVRLFKSEEGRGSRKPKEKYSRYLLLVVRASSCPVGWHIWRVCIWEGAAESKVMVKNVRRTMFEPNTGIGNCGKILPWCLVHEERQVRKKVKSADKHNYYTCQMSNILFKASGIKV